LGGPEHSAITVTEGLLRGMTMGEIAGILAHEVAHIRNNDGWAMALAAALHRATSLTALLGQAQRHDRPLATLVSSAPMIGQLLHMALSRLREYDADAVALELVDDPHAFLAALHKLEYHHNGIRPWTPASASNDMLRFLRSHPETWERVGTLLSLAWP
jgi:heat shock protein HtpX